MKFNIDQERTTIITNKSVIKIVVGVLLLTLLSLMIGTAYTMTYDLPAPTIVLSVLTLSLHKAITTSVHDAVEEVKINWSPIQLLSLTSYLSVSTYAIYSDNITIALVLAFMLLKDYNDK